MDTQPNKPHLPREGDQAPSFEAETQRGKITFPDYAHGQWCILFAHPSNFSSAWMMFNAFMVLKERWFDERNTKLIGLASTQIRPDEWTDKMRRYIDIYLKAPVILDTEKSIAQMYGLSVGRKMQPDHNRVAFIIDPEGIIRLIVKRPIDGIHSAIHQLELELNRLQGKLDMDGPIPCTDIATKQGGIDTAHPEAIRPTYFDFDSLNQN
jgi:peroxiredoxin 2/4